MTGPTLESAGRPDIPGWTLLRIIGRGSYGEVWLAQNAEGAWRAVKIVRRGNFDHDRPYQRELSGIRRFEPISRDQPSQVAVFSVGEDLSDGFFYYVMELADDAAGVRPINPVAYRPKTLKSEAARRGRLPHTECLDIGLALATALDHLHRHGLVHRDIKPSNVIFVDGVPKLADIGLVTGLDATVSYVGTEGFLPPEGPGTPRADLYSLGKVLYEISTGQDRLDFPELPTLAGDSRVALELLELNQVLLKACQNDPAQRYQTAPEMLADLRVLREGRSLRQLRQRAARIRRAQIALAVLVALVVVGVSATQWLQYSRRHRLEQKKMADATADQVARSKVAEHFASLYGASGDSLIRDGDPLGAIVFYQRAWEVTTNDDARSEVLRQRIRSILNEPPFLTYVVSATNGLRGAHYSLDGRRLLTLDRDGIVRFYDASTGAFLSTVPLPHRVRMAELDPEGDRALVTDDTGGVFLVLNIDRRPAPSLLTSGAVTPPTLSPNGRQFAMVHQATNLTVWETSARREHLRLPQSQPIDTITFSPGGDVLAAVIGERSLRLWNPSSGDTIGRTIDLPSQASRLRFSPDGRWLLAITKTNVVVFNARSADALARQPAAEPSVIDACFTADSREIIAGGSEPTIKVWEVATGRLVTALQQSDPVQQIVPSPDGRLILVVTTKAVQLWDGIGWTRKSWSMVIPTNPGPASFASAGTRFLVPSVDEAFRAFTFQHDNTATSIDEVLKTATSAQSWAHLLSGRHLTESNTLAALAPSSVEPLWRTIRSRLTQTNSGQHSVALAWHEREAIQAESNHWWFTAAFHWDRLSVLRPRDPTARDHATKARLALARADVTATRPPEMDRRLPPRSPETPRIALDLGLRYNAFLDQSWLPGAPDNDLSALTPGLHHFNGVAFDVRGVIQLSSRTMEVQGGRYPKTIDDLPIGQKAGRLHFLHGAAWASLIGTPIGRYVVHYEGGDTQEIRIVFGRDVREWWASPTQQPLTAGVAVAWEGSNRASTMQGFKLRLFQMTWKNPHPTQVIARIEFESFMESSAPFLLAITVEPPPE